MSHLATTAMVFGWRDGSTSRNLHPKDVDFVLVQSGADYRTTVLLGGQPILVRKKFSVTDARAKLFGALGPLFLIWRWRRVLLNEGIATLYVPRGTFPPFILIAAVLAGARVRFAS